MLLPWGTLLAPSSGQTWELHQPPSEEPPGEARFGETNALEPLLRGRKYNILQATRFSGCVQATSWWPLELSYLIVNYFIEGNNILL